MGGIKNESESCVIEMSFSFTIRYCDVFITGVISNVCFA